MPLSLPLFQIAEDLMSLPGLPHPQTAQIARHREQQIARRRAAASIWQQTVGATTRQSLTRAGEREVTGTFEAVQDLPEAQEVPEFAPQFNLFLQQLLGF